MAKHVSIFLGVLCLVATSLAGCAPEPEPVTEQVFDVEADIKAQYSLATEYDAAVNTRDLDRLMNMYADDAVSLPPYSSPLEGKEAIRANQQQLFDQYDSDMENVAVDAQVDGDLAFSRGTWKSIETPRNGGDPLEQHGEWVSIHKRQSDGSWKIICEIWNNKGAPEQ